MRIRGDIYENFAMGLQTLRANKLRSFLTVIGVMIGVITVMLIASIISGIDEQVKDAQEFAWGIHAGEGETSWVMAIAPELVHMDRTADLGEYPRMPDGVEHLAIRGPVGFSWLTARMRRADLMRSTTTAGTDSAYAARSTAAATGWSRAPTRWALSRP